MLAVVSMEWLAPTAWGREQVVPCGIWGDLLASHCWRESAPAWCWCWDQARAECWLSSCSGYHRVQGFAFIIPIFASLSLPFPWEQSYMLKYNNNNKQRNKNHVPSIPVKLLNLYWGCVFNCSRGECTTCSKQPVVFRNVPESCSSYSFIV